MNGRLLVVSSHDFLKRSEILLLNFSKFNPVLLYFIIEGQGVRVVKDQPVSSPCGSLGLRQNPLLGLAHFESVPPNFIKLERVVVYFSRDVKGPRHLELLTLKHYVLTLNDFLLDFSLDGLRLNVAGLDFLFELAVILDNPAPIVCVPLEARLHRPRARINDLEGVAAGKLEGRVKAVRQIECV